MTDQLNFYIDGAWVPPAKPATRDVINPATETPIAKISMERLSIAIIPFFAVMVLVLFLIAFVPEMTTWLPRLAGYQ